MADDQHRNAIADAGEPSDARADARAADARAMVALAPTPAAAREVAVMNASPASGTWPPESAERQYLRAISLVALLTVSEEVALARRIAAGMQATAALNVLSLPSEERQSQERLVADGMVAQHQMIEANLRLVVSIARHYLNRGMALLDLIQEGNLGLMRAVEKFDHTRGFKFSTYATWWVRQAILRAITDQGRTIRLPAHAFEAVQRITRAVSRLQQALGRDATPDELERELGIPAPEVSELLVLAQHTISLDAPAWTAGAGDDSLTPLRDTVPDKMMPSADDLATQGLLVQEMSRLLTTLSEREQHVLRLRYGLAGKRLHTLKEVGVALNITRERVRQIESSALRKLRSPQHRQQLLGFLN